MTYYSPFPILMKLTKHKGPHAYEFTLIKFYSWVDTYTTILFQVIFKGFMFVLL
jgi:hypothetical protein